MLNEYYKNISIKQYIERYGILNTLRRGLFTALPFHFVRDYEMRKVLWQKKASKKIDKYMEYKDSDVPGLVFGKIDIEDPIWIYWNNGIEKAPDIVKACYRSVSQFYGDRIVLLSDKNIGEYITMPKIIEEKKNSGTLTLAHYADLVRFALLEHFGGLWVDATIFLSGKIPDQVFNSSFFVMQNSLGLLDNPVLYPVWFIRAKKNNVTMRRIRNVAFAYFLKGKRVIEYLVSNIILTKVIREDDIYIPYMNSDYSEYLIKCLGDEYSKEKLDWIFELTSIHKLSYKLDDSIAKFNTAYRYLIENNRG